MLAYSKSTLQFRDQSTPLSDEMSKVQPHGGARPSWSLHSGGDSDDDEDNGRAEEPSLFTPPGTVAQRLPFSEDAAAQPNNSMNPYDSAIPTPAIYPAEHNAIVQVGEHLSEPWASSFFSFDTFNAVQSACFNPAACTDENMVVSAPTGCGKTVIFELAILRLLSCRRSNQDAKVVFMAPIKALCQEKCVDWTARFSKLGIKVAELSGDQVNSDIKEVTSAQIICTTPEKWDSITRRWTEHIYLLGKVQLLLVDEAHNIGENRGAALEAVVCRMKTVAKSAPVIKHNLPAKDLRIIALSATLPNLTCIGEFVNASSENIMAFDGSFRPVPLTVHVVGYAAQSSDFWFEKALEKKVPDVIARYSGGRPSLVFCTSRKSAETTVEIMCRSGNASSWHRDPALAAAALRVSTPSLRDALNRGIAFHHANLPPNERNLVEDLFRARKLNVLCCTSTLAMGVNLPAHLVVIKSTAQWQGKASGYSQMSSSTILQMMGRAGRPGLDDHGIAVIMTDEANKTRYENMSSGCEIVESNLHEVLAEVLNSEVCNAVIESVEDAAEWVKSTFLFTRLKKNPSRYGLCIPMDGDIDTSVTSFLNDKIRAALQDLTSVGVLAVDDDGYEVKACASGHTMSRFMLQLGTMQKILSIEPDANINELLFALSSTAEVLQEVRMGQKKHLKDLNRLVRFGLPKSKKLESVDKTYLLLQNVLGQSPMDDVTMQREQIMIGEKAGRVLQGLCDHLVDVRGGRAVLSSVILRRNIEKGLWETDVSELSQLEGLNPKELAKLGECGYEKLQSVAEASAMELDASTGRRAPFGTRLVASARRILGQALSIAVNHDSSQDRITINVTRKLASWAKSSSISSSDRVPDCELVSYTLVAFTKQPKHAKSNPSGEASSVHGLHLFRKINEPCTIVLPAASMPAVRASTLLVSLVGNFVGLDDHKGLTLPGAASAVPGKEAEHLGDGGGKGTADASDQEDAPTFLSVTAASSSSSSSFSSLNSSSKMSGESATPSKAAPRPKALPKKPKSGAETSQPTAKTKPASDMSLGNLDQFRYSESAATTPKPATDMSLGSSDKFCFSETIDMPASDMSLENSDNLRYSGSSDKFRYSETAAKTPPVLPPRAPTRTPTEARPARTTLSDYKDAGLSFSASDKFRDSEGGGPASAHKVNPSSDTWGVENERGKSGSAKLSPTLRGAECGHVPRAGTFSRKGSVGNRDIRDCLNTNPLNTIRRKATEMNLLENVKSSKLAGQPYIPPDQPAIKPFSSQTWPSHGAAAGGGITSLHFDAPPLRTPPAPPSSGKNPAPRAGGGFHGENGAPSMGVLTTGQPFFKRQPSNDVSPPFEQRSQVAPQQTEPQQHYGFSASVRAPSSQHQLVPFDSRNHQGSQAPLHTQQRSEQASRCPPEFSTLGTQPMPGMPPHMKTPGQMTEARFLSQPSGPPAYSALPERKINAPPSYMNQTPRQLGPPPSSMPRGLTGPPPGVLSPRGLPKFAHQAPLPTLSVLQQNRKQPVRTTPGMNNDINVKRSRNIQGPQHQAQHQRPAKTQGISEVRVPFASAPFSQTDFDEFF